MRKLALVLALAGLQACADVRRVHPVSDLAEDAASWPVAFDHARAAAGGAELRLEREGLVVHAPAAVQARIAGALDEARRGKDVPVTIEIHFARFRPMGATASTVPASRVEAFLKGRCERLGSATLFCLNLHRVGAEIVSETTYVADFQAEVSMGHVSVSEPTIGKAKESWTATLRPVVAGGSVRVEAEFAVTEIVRPIPDFWTLVGADVPLRILLPESRSRTVARGVACVPDAFALVDLGDSTVALVRATAAR